MSNLWNDQPAGGHERRKPVVSVIVVVYNIPREGGAHGAFALRQLPAPIVLRIKVVAVALRRRQQSVAAHFFS
jgi:hypothetical protein